MRLDTLFARIERYEADSLIQRLKVLGHVIVHTRQLDMAMFNDRMVDFYYSEMVRSIQSAFEAEPI
jgi:pyruvate,water dikinase